METQPSPTRYENKVPYVQCGKSGLVLPRISLGLWHNFGDVDDFSEATKMIQFAFDNGITHFDLANNYGPPEGSAEENFGKILHHYLPGYRDEMIISTKAGHRMWPGPYGDGGSRKYLIASLNQSLKRMKLDYVDIFYSHRYDPNTPLEETMNALSDIVKQGKALYVGISKYPVDKTIEAYSLLKANGTPCLIHQDRYSMLSRDIEEGILQAADDHGVGFIGFSPLYQGVLSDKYLHGIPENSRAAKSTGFLQRSQISPEILDKVTALNSIAIQRGQTLAQMALIWCLRHPTVTSVIVGTSSLKQLQDNIDALHYPRLSEEEIAQIDTILQQK
ncbi:aldo/keto reductase [Paludibacter sp.]|uniref:aldo/keto reductase n=1 Tax=Paludibacter sp. TaxID=1898105 RepID=UPI0013542959|nr:aldo/keto reductase [Paludibacter sp.]MTK54194.1 L-glyceraldehyde 3-phosphate reductase [Paludibacter sp.]